MYYERKGFNEHPVDSMETEAKTGEIGQRVGDKLDLSQLPIPLHSLLRLINNFGERERPGMKWGGVNFVTAKNNLETVCFWCESSTVQLVIKLKE